MMALGRRLGSRRCRWHSSVAGLLIVLFVGPSARCQSIDRAKQALKSLEQSIAAIQSYDVQIVVRQTVLFDYVAEGDGPKKHMTLGGRKATPKVVTFFGRQTKLGELHRVDEFDNDGQSILVSHLTRPQSEMSYRPTDREAIVTDWSSYASFGGCDYRILYEFIFEKSTICETLQHRNSLRLIEETPDSTLLELRADPENRSDTSFPDSALKVVLDVEKGLLPAESVVLSKREGKLQPISRVKVLKWQKLRDGAWVPTQGVRQAYHYDAAHPDGVISAEFEISVDLSRSSWNGSVDKSRFSLEIPSGTKVVDFRENTQYVTGQTVLGNDLSALAAQAKQVLSVQTSPPLDSKHPYSWIVLSATAGFVIIIAIAIFIRYRNKGLI